MKAYIGLGGIGCRTLQQYANNCENVRGKEFYFIDSDLTSLNPKNAYVVPGLTFGSATLRCIGRNAVTYELLTGRMEQYFSRIRQQRDRIQLIFVLSSFGGFGGAAVGPVMDYLEALTWGRIKSCTVISFNEGAYARLGFPAQLFQRFEANTIDFVNDISLREQSQVMTRKFDPRLFNPGCISYLIDTSEISPESFWEYLDAPSYELGLLDCKDRYSIPITPTIEKKPVFISYSSKDQAVADMIADELQASGISPWIATRDIKAGSYPKQIMNGIRNADIFLVLISKNSINSEHVKNEIDRAFSRLKDGIKIVPFILDNTELDEECQYYLCRQEFISGETPPIQDRVRYLVDRIIEIVR